MKRSGLAALVVGTLIAAPAHAEPVTEVRIAPSARGVLGAWAIAGPFPTATADQQVVAVPLSKWKLVTSGGPGQDPGSEGARTIDLKSSLDDARGRDIVAFATGKLHLESAGPLYLLLGVDDGVQVNVDGKVVYTRDEPRPLRDDDDVVPLHLTAGEHTIVLRFHQRDGAWAFRARVVGEDFRPPAGAYLTVPTATADAAKTLASKMSWLVVDRGFDSRSSPPTYRPVLTVRYPEGAPIGVPIAVNAKIDGQFDVNAGGVTGPDDLVVALPPVEPWSGTLTLESTVAGRVVKLTLVARPETEQALVHFDKAIARIGANEPWLAPGSLDSARHLAKRLARFVSRGDADAEAQLAEAKELDQVAEALSHGTDPYAERTGMMRRALVTPFDEAPTEYGLYVPPSFKRGSDSAKKYPLIVGLHGMNSAPLSMMRALFGQDDAQKDPWWKDRHAVPLPPVDAFVITPYAHGNTMYREIGEDDVLYVMDWARKAFPIDDTRITITGPSMGGIGSAALPFHYPGVFAAAEPLCGYHSYLIRAELNVRPKRPWERALLEERSNVLWAENGEHLPLYIVHGTRDLPVANSNVLIEEYEKLKYSVKHEHPDLGHNVWGVTYGDLKGIKWLLSQKLAPNPAHVRFRTMKTRYATSSWVTVDELDSELGWADIDARITGSNFSLKTTGATQLTLARPNGTAATAVAIDGTSLSYAADEPLVMHKDGAAWAKGAASHAGLFKHGHVTGPLRDVFHDPITFVYADGTDAQANEKVARGFAERPGIPAGYPVLSDTEFLARNEPLANDRALFLVGRSNRVLAELEKLGPLPIHVGAGAVAIAGQSITGREVGAAYIYPNPARPDRYVVVVAGADVAGTLRASSLPDLLPDFVVWDADLAPARGQVLLGGATLRAGGMFKNDWSLPAVIADPLAKRPRGPAQSPPEAEPNAD